MPAKTRVAIAGASGSTGLSVVNALLATPEKFEVTALTQPSSVGKPEYVALAKRGVIIRPIALSGPSGAIAEAIDGMDVVMSCMTLFQLKEEMALIDAANEAGVGRFVPSFFGPCCPPRGVMLARDMKESFLDHIKKLYLPFTIIDVGWWYQASLPPLPSGRIMVNEEFATTQIIGSGDIPSALTDNRDIGKYAAKIIVDSRTLNKSVFIYSEVWTQNRAFELLGKISGESIPREYLTEDELLRIISEGQTQLAINNTDSAAMMSVGMAQYRYLLGIRGDNTLDHAAYLGYLDAKELYPDVEATPLEKYVKELVEGSLKTVPS